MLLQAVQPSAGKESPLWDLIHSLQERSSWNRVKPFLTFETRYFQASSLGFALEISKYYQSINAINLNGEQPDHWKRKKFVVGPKHQVKSDTAVFCACFVAKAAVNPPLTETLKQLLTSEVSLESDGSFG